MSSGVNTRQIVELLRTIGAVVESLPELPGLGRQAVATRDALRELAAGLEGEGGPSLDLVKTRATLTRAEELLSAAAGDEPDSREQKRVEAARQAARLMLSLLARTAAAAQEDSGFGLAQQEIDRRPAFPETPLDAAFIIGYRRSGTTLLSWMLDSHPGIAAVPENFVCLSLLAAPAAAEGPGERPRPWITTAQKSTEPLGEPRRRYHRRVAGLIDGVFSDYAAGRGKRRWVAKEVFLHDRLDLLDLVFDYSSRFLFLHRHGLDCAFSAAQRFGSRAGAPAVGGLDVTSYLEEWVENTEATLDFVERNPERCHAVGYEELVREPERVAGEVLLFLGEPWHPTLLEDMRAQDHHPGLGDPKIFDTGGRVLSERIGRWRDWPLPLLRQLGRLADPTLRRLGYEPVGDA